MWPFAKKKQEKHYKFTDEDREISAEVREAEKRAKLAKIQKQQEIDEARLDLELLKLKAAKNEYEDDEDDFDDLIPEDDESLTSTLIKIFGPAIAQKMAANVSSNPVINNPNPTSSSPTQEVVVDPGYISNEELSAIWENTPEKYRKIAVNLNDGLLGQAIKKQIPTANEDSIKRAIHIIRAGAP